MAKNLLTNIKFDGKIIYEPTAKQAEVLSLFMKDEEVIALYGGAVGGGKSWCIAGFVLMQSLLYPGNRGFVCRKTGADFKKTTYLTLKETLFKHPGLLMGQGEWSKDKYFKLFNGSRIDYGGIDTVGNLKSLEVNFIAADEAFEMDDEIFETFIERTPRWGPKEGRPPRRILLGSNPGMGFLYNRFVRPWEGLAEFEPYFHFIQALPTHNPHLPTGYEEGLRRVFGPKRARKYLDGDWHVILEAHPVYEDEFNADYHETDLEYNPYLTLYRGWDFGLTPAVVFCQVSSEGSLHVLAEIVSDRVTGVEKFARDIVLPYTLNNFPETTRIKDYCDPAGFIREQLRAYSICDRLAKPDIGIAFARGEREQDRRRMCVTHWLNKMVMGSPAFLMDKSKCPKLYEGFLGYFKYKDKAIISEKPLFQKNEWSHVHEALQYVISGINQELAIYTDIDKIISDITHGDDVYKLLEMSNMYPNIV